MARSRVNIYQPKQSEAERQETLFNQEVQQWNNKTKRQIKAEIQRLSQSGKGRLYRSLTARMRKSDGQVFAIGYKFLRYGVFWQKGVGRGWPIERVKQNGRILENGGRKPQPWFNEPIEERIEELADIAARHQLEINAKKIRIN